MLKKDKMFENLGKNVQNLNIFWKKQVIACDNRTQLSARISSENIKLFSKRKIKTWTNNNSDTFERWHSLKTILLGELWIVSLL